jgi:hypothetical protein
MILRQLLTQCPGPSVAATSTTPRRAEAGTKSKTDSLTSSPWLNKLATSKTSLGTQAGDFCRLGFRELRDPQPVPGLKYLLLQGLEGKNTMWPLSHGLKLLAKFYEAVCGTQDLDEDDDDDCNDAMLLNWLMDTCDNGDEEDEDFVQPFYYDGPSNMGWLSDREGPLFLLIDFNRRFVLMADESLCLLKRSWSGREYVDNVIKSPLEGYADVRVRDQSMSFILWWEDYIEGGRASVVSIGGLS